MCSDLITIDRTYKNIFNFWLIDIMVLVLVYKWPWIVSGPALEYMVLVLKKLGLGLAACGLDYITY